jgi:hypothetical protein
MVIRSLAISGNAVNRDVRVKACFLVRVAAEDVVSHYEEACTLNHLRGSDQRTEDKEMTTDVG